MQRLLYTLSYDRKVSYVHSFACHPHGLTICPPSLSVDNWQTTLRKQYSRREPQANPIGPDPKDAIKETEEFEYHESEAFEVLPDTAAIPKEVHSASRKASAEPTSPAPTSPSRQSSVARNRLLKDSTHGEEQHSAPPIDWFDLPMLSKLESMHTLAEWQFQNPMRLRTIMKTDDEAALWVRFL
jgi:hypothetical protein